MALSGTAFVLMIVLLELIFLLLLDNNQYESRLWQQCPRKEGANAEWEGGAFFLCTGLVNVTMLLEFGPEHLNTLSITPEILAGHTWLLLQLSCGLNLYVVSRQT